MNVQDALEEVVAASEWCDEAGYQGRASLLHRAHKALHAELERLTEARVLAKTAKATAAAPEYDQEATSDALWAVVDSLFTATSEGAK